jgi:hypothetical protein
VKGGLTTVPYNEVYVRVGGVGRIVGGVDVCTGKACNDADGSGRSFDLGKAHKIGHRLYPSPLVPNPNIILTTPFPLQRKIIDKVSGFPWRSSFARRTSVIWSASYELVRGIPQS